MTEGISLFNIRVYGILINQANEVLLTDEYWFDTKMTKFPGGGLDSEEGTIDCLKREWKEEMNQTIEVVKHLYTTDFYYTSQFKPGQQIVCIYYKVKTVGDICFKISNVPFDFNDISEGAQSFRWKKISKLSEDDLSFPSDKKLVPILMK